VARQYPRGIDNNPKASLNISVDNAGKVVVFFVPPKYREGIYTPSSDLSGAINQVLDQRYKLQKEISSIKENTRMYDIETYSVHCAVIVDTMLEGVDEQKSIELFRGNLKEVNIVTFDEMLEKLKVLKNFIASNPITDRE
jgi:hypothetical protein